MDSLAQRCRPKQLPKQEPVQMPEASGQEPNEPTCEAELDQPTAGTSPTVYRPTMFPAEPYAADVEQREEKYVPVAASTLPQSIPTIPAPSSPYNDSHGQWLQCDLFDTNGDRDPFQEAKKGDGLLIHQSDGSKWLLKFKDSKSAKSFLTINDFNLKFGNGLQGLEAVSGERPWSLQMRMKDPAWRPEPKNIKRHFVKNRFALLTDPIVGAGLFEVPFANLRAAEAAYKKYNGKDINGQPIASIQFKPFL